MYFLYTVLILHILSCTYDIRYMIYDKPIILCITICLIPPTQFVHYILMILSTFLMSSFAYAISRFALHSTTYSLSSSSHSLSLLTFTPTSHYIQLAFLFYSSILFTYSYPYIICIRGMWLGWGGGGLPFRPFPTYLYFHLPPTYNYLDFSIIS